MRKIFPRLIGGFFFVFLFILIFISPIDFTPLEEQTFYTRMKARLDTFNVNTYPPTHATQVGWSKFSIVPDTPMPLAGYKPREKYDAIHDSIYMRIMAISNGAVTAFVITADLLLFPPALKKSILNKLKPDAQEFIYFNATHTHTSVGGWDPTLLGEVLMGEYNEDWIEKLSTQTVDFLEIVKQSMKASSLSYFEVDASEYMINRIDPSAAVDGKIRGLHVLRGDGKTALLFALGVHPTFISKKLRYLSGDYPGEIMKLLSQQYDYTQFMAGVVGSQRFHGFETKYDFELTEAAGELFAEMLKKTSFEQLPQNISIKTGRIEVEHGPSQLRLLSDIKLRDWVFQSVSQPLEGEITSLLIGNILFIGTSCDFAGEIAVNKNLESKAKANGLKLIITSFNGEYTGYITADQHYLDHDDEEVRILNWVGPYFGQYYSEIIEELFVKFRQ